MEKALGMIPKYGRTKAKSGHRRFAVKKEGLNACNVIKNRLQNKCFFVKFLKFLRTPIWKNICEPLFQRSSKLAFGQLKKIYIWNSITLQIILAFYFNTIANCVCKQSSGQEIMNKMCNLSCNKSESRFASCFTTHS